MGQGNGEKLNCGTFIIKINLSQPRAMEYLEWFLNHPNCINQCFFAKASNVPCLQVCKWQDYDSMEAKIPKP